MEGIYVLGVVGIIAISIVVVAIVALGGKFRGSYRDEKRDVSVRASGQASKDDNST